MEHDELEGRSKGKHSLVSIIERSMDKSNMGINM
jgi:hypothetical protein